MDSLSRGDCSKDADHQEESCRSRSVYTLTTNIVSALFDRYRSRGAHMCVLSVCMRAGIVYMYVYIYMYACAYVCMFTRMWTHTRTPVLSSHMCVRACGRACECLHICIYYILAYVYKYSHITHAGTDQEASKQLKFELFRPDGTKAAVSRMTIYVSNKPLSNFDQKEPEQQ